MTARLLCDENVELDTVTELEGRGIPAAHVTDRPGAGADDEQVAAHARETGTIVLTNDADFLDSSRFPDVRVFYYPENDLAAHRVVRRVETVLDPVSTADGLPATLFLTTEYDDV